MSQFLAPIHTWLSNKILILEEIERDIIDNLREDQRKLYYEQVQTKFGGFIPDVPLESLIDPANIHGWLQERITIAESRQAALVGMIMTDSNHSLNIITEHYRRAGVRVAERIGIKLDSAVEIYQTLNNMLLEGMPCDRVLMPIEQTDHRMEWQTTHCVHKDHWEANDVDVTVYYGFREAFTIGFVETISEGFSYSYNRGTEQSHILMRK